VIAGNFPCKRCTHGASRHYTSVGGGEPICLDCAVSKHTVNPDEHWHEFEGDNLKYTELLVRKAEIRNEL
jgi:hypothetical protein